MKILVAAFFVVITQIGCKKDNSSDICWICIGNGETQVRCSDHRPFVMDSDGNIMTCIKLR